MTINSYLYKIWLNVFCGLLVWLKWISNTIMLLCDPTDALMITNFKFQNQLACDLRIRIHKSRSNSILHTTTNIFSLEKKICRDPPGFHWWPIISESREPLGRGYGGHLGTHSGSRSESLAKSPPRPKINFRFLTPPRYQLRVPKFYIVSIISASFLSQVFHFMLTTDWFLQIYTLWITIFKVPTWGILLLQIRKWHFDARCILLKTIFFFK